LDKDWIWIKKRFSDRDQELKNQYLLTCAAHLCFPAALFPVYVTFGRKDERTLKTYMRWVSEMSIGLDLEWTVTGLQQILLNLDWNRTINLLKLRIRTGFGLS